MDASVSSVVRLTTTAELANRVVDALAEQFEALDAAAAMFEEPGGGWSVAIHFRERPNETAVRALVGIAAGADTANALTFETIATRDWVEASLAGLPAVEAGRFIVHGAHSRALVPKNRIGIEIEAALAFGTGHHGTTRGCLLALDAIIKSLRPRKILDIGTGSGVLAIATARALHRPVLASDIDGLAARVARSNAQLNRAGADIRIIRAHGLADGTFRTQGPFDLVFANILLKPVIGLATPMRRLLAPRARVVLSGLLLAQGTPALNTYLAQGLALERRIVLGGWVTLVLRRR